MSEVLQSQEIVRLYEYEPCKPDLEDYIEHHGVKDMHWGVRNGPPYPLSSKLSTGSRLKKGAKGAGGSYGGNPDRLKKKAAKAAVKAAKANKKAAQAGNSLLHPFKAKKKDKLQTKAFKAQAKADKLNAKLDKEELKAASKKRLEEINKKKSEQSGEVRIANETREAIKKYDKDLVKLYEDGAAKKGPFYYQKNEKEINKKIDEIAKSSGLSKKEVADAVHQIYEEEKDVAGNKIKADKALKKAAGRDFDGDTKYGGKEKDLKKASGADFDGDVTNKKEEPKKSFKEKMHDKKVQKQRVQSLEKARQTKAENTAKKKAEAEEKEKISKMREEAIKKADIVTMYKNADHFSNEEIQNALNRKGTLDRLAAEVSKSVPKTTETPKKQGYVKTAVKTKLKEGAKSGFESVVKNVGQEALKMTLEQLALSAAGVNVNSKLNDKQKLQVRRQNILRLIKTNK